MAVRQAYTPKEVGKILGLARTALYAAIRSGEIKSFRIGGKILISKAVIDRLLASHRVTSTGRAKRPKKPSNRK